MINRTSTEATVRISESRAKAWSVEAFVAAGMRSLDAALVADNLVSADCRGLFSHGLMRARVYVERLRTLATDPLATPVILRESGPTLLIDGRNAMGQVVADFAMGQAIAKARESGVGVASVRGSNHFGACEYYALKATSSHMIGVVATVSALNIMAPFGGAEPLLGNNPLAISVPTREAPPLVLDMAMSVAAGGKIRLAAKTGESIPNSWALDAAGKPTSNAKEALAGTVLPMGGHKGYGLSLIVAMLAAILPGAAFGRDVSNLYEEFTRGQNVGHFMEAIDVGRFTDPELFGEQVDAAIDLMHSAKRAPGVDRILVPGEREHLIALEQRAQGIRYPRAIVEDLNVIGRELGISSLVAV